MREHIRQRHSAFIVGATMDGQVQMITWQEMAVKLISCFEAYCRKALGSLKLGEEYGSFQSHRGSAKFTSRQ